LFNAILVIDNKNVEMRGNKIFDRQVDLKYYKVCPGIGVLIPLPNEV